MCCINRYLIFLILLFNVVSLRADSFEPKPPITIILNDWTSQIVLSRVVGSLLSDMGYEVAYRTFTIDMQWGALQRGLGHIQVEVWEGTMAENFDKQVSEGAVLDAGTHTATTREDWWYPRYVKNMCPNLPDWEALKRCAKLFALPDSRNKGAFITGPWNRYEGQRIRALELDFIVYRVENSAEIWNRLREAVSNNKPIMLNNWTPNWVEARIEGDFVEFPDYEADCRSVPEWGINQRQVMDCGWPKNGWLKKAAWVGMKKQWPCAYALLENIDLNNEMIAEASALVDYDGLSYELAVKRWLEKYAEDWEGWIPTSC